MTAKSLHQSVSVPTERPAEPVAATEDVALNTEQMDAVAGGAGGWAVLMQDVIISSVVKRPGDRAGGGN